MINVRIATAAAVVAATFAACFIPMGMAGGVTAPRLVGSYPTSVRIVADTTANPALPIGYTAVRTWRFVRHCSSSGCTTTLSRPSIVPGSSRVFRYSLRPITGGRYQGTLNVPDVCYGATKTLAPGSIVDHVVITIRPTRTSAAKVVAFGGTMVLRYVVPAWAKAEGCIVKGSQTSSINSPA
jgi:hypothetical protein